MTIIIALLLSALFSFKTFAEVPVDPMLSLCMPYPEIKDSNLVPIEFNTTNNLARSPDSAFYQAEGQKIVVYGRLMDVDCVPINDGKIYIWQNNKDGYVQYKTKKTHHAKWIDPNFVGTGITNSDNLGRFNFITIMPGSVSKTTRHINIKVEHPQLKTFYSKIYFPKPEETKIHDNIHRKVNINQISAVPGKINEQGLVTEYFIDITLHQKVPYKEY